MWFVPPVVPAEPVWFQWVSLIFCGEAEEQLTPASGLGDGECGWRTPVMLLPGGCYDCEREQGLLKNQTLGINDSSFRKPTNSFNSLCQKLVRFFVAGSLWTVNFIFTLLYCSLSCGFAFTSQLKKTPNTMKCCVESFVKFLFEALTKDSFNEILHLLLLWRFLDC